MVERSLAMLFAPVFLFALVGCASAEAPAPVTGAPPTKEDPAAGSRVAMGLHDLGGGAVQALGMLEHLDLEGGFWAITRGTGDAGEVVAVIANGDELSGTLGPLEGRVVMATGTRSEGPSIRMAGPEMVATEVVEVSDTPGAVE